MGKTRSLLTLTVLLLTIGLAGTFAFASTPEKGDQDTGTGMMMGSCPNKHGMMNMMKKGKGKMQGHGMMEGCPQPGMIARQAVREVRSYISNAEKIGLNEEQIKRLKAISEQLETDLIKKKANMKVAVIRLKNLMKSYTPKPADAKARVKEVSKALEDLLDTTTQAVIEARGILTPEERKKASAL